MKFILSPCHLNGPCRFSSLDASLHRDWCLKNLHIEISWPSIFYLSWLYDCFYYCPDHPSLGNWTEGLSGHQHSGPLNPGCRNLHVCCKAEQYNSSWYTSLFKDQNMHEQVWVNSNSETSNDSNYSNSSSTLCHVSQCANLTLEKEGKRQRDSRCKNSPIRLLPIHLYESSIQHTLQCQVHVIEDGQITFV